MKFGTGILYKKLLGLFTPISVLTQLIAVCAIVCVATPVTGSFFCVFDALYEVHYERLIWRPRPSVRPSIRPTVCMSVCLSVCLSVTYYQRLNRLSDFHEIRYRNSLQKVVRKG
jgi:hypothetical protein